MAISVKLDDLLYARRMTLTELAERVDITLDPQDRQGQGHPFFHAGINLSGAGMPAGGFAGI
jgi:hypothetical protein